MKLIVGLGNPGKEYENTRHNIGFMVVDKYLGNIRYKEKFNGLYYELDNEEKIIFLKPQTFMNNSGVCVKKFTDYYKIPSENILIIHDDLDLELGKIKYKINSSSGGHNGIKSIINMIGTKNFIRLKVGISHIEKKHVIDYVLGKFSKNEIDIINFENIIYSINDYINNDYDYVMNKYNRK